MRHILIRTASFAAAFGFLLLSALDVTPGDGTRPASPIAQAPADQHQQIKKFTSDTLPTIQQHLDTARTLSAGK